MKIEQVLIQQLYSNKEITLQGIGSFRLDTSVTLQADSEKGAIVPGNAITFEYNHRAGEDAALIDAIVQHTKKIRPLASADLDSYLTLGKQFLNIGKPFTIEGIGTLDKAMSGELIFTPGHFITPRIEPPKALKEDEMEEKSGLFPDYDSEIKRSHGRKTALIIFLILLLGLGAWASYHFVFKKKAPEENTLPEVTEKPAATDSPAAKHDTNRVQPVNNQPVNNGDNYTFKIVFKETRDKDDALKSYNKMSGFGHKVILYTNDSVIYKVAEPFTLPLSDTTHIKDSLNKYYYLGKAYVEVGK